MPDVTATPAASSLQVKTKKFRQRACDQKGAKGKACLGHLKRWYEYPEGIARVFGKNAELYRCERCKTLYQPDVSELPRSYIHRY
ncbi:MAG: hypothetical protein ACE5H2_03110 [Terriglobia bacterium]